MKIIAGDIIGITTGTILHQTNCRGVVGGLAGALARKWPKAFEQYFAACRSDGHLLLGASLIGKASEGLFICHVFGQLNPGANTDMDAVNQALCDAAMMTPPPTSPIYAPYKMGCGLGGGKWGAYLEELEEWFPEIILVQREGDR